MICINKMQDLYAYSPPLIWDPISWEWGKYESPLKPNIDDRILEKNGTL